MSSSMSRCKWCGKDVDNQHAVEAFRPEGESYGFVCSDQCLALAGCVSKEKKERLEKEAAIRRSLEEGRQLLQQEKYEEAITAADKMAALDGKCVEAKVIKGIALAKKGRYELAIPELEEALKLDSDHAEAKTTLEALFSDGNHLVDYAKVKYEEKAFDTVVLLASKMIERSPSRFDAYLLRGKSHRQTKKYKEAVQDFAQALDRSPEDAKKEILRERGACHHDLKEFQAAIDNCSAALQIDGQDAPAFLIRGKSYLAMKEHALAAVDFYESARLDQGTKGEAVKGIEECETHLTTTMLAEVSDKPTAKLTSQQHQGLGKIIEIYKLKDKVGEIEKTKKRPASPLLVGLSVLGLASIVSCFGLFAVPFRYEWYGPFLFLNLTWVAFAVGEVVRFKKQQALDKTVNAPLVEAIEQQFTAIKEHETSFGLDRHPKREPNYAPAIVGVGAVLLVISSFWLIFINSQQSAKAAFGEAGQLWVSGKKEEAIEKYKSIIKSITGLSALDASEGGVVVERVIDFYLERNDISAAKAILTKVGSHGSATLHEKIRDAEDSQTVDEGHRLWDTGNTKAAIKAYHDSAFRQWKKTPGFRKADKALIYSRTIEVNVKLGASKDYARKLIAEGLDEGIQLTLSPESVIVVKEVEADRKLAAFQAIVSKLKQFPDKLASDAERKQFNSEVEALLRPFEKMPLDVNASAYTGDKAKAIVNEFNQDVKGRYSGQLVNLFEAYVAAIAVTLRQ